MTTTSTAAKPLIRKSINCYEILDLSDPDLNVPPVDKAEIKQAYRRALLVNHPDKSQVAGHVHRKRSPYTIDELSGAYHTLMDPKQRLEHDRQLQLRLRAESDNNHADSHPCIETLDLDEFNCNDPGALPRPSPLRTATSLSAGPNAPDNPYNFHGSVMSKTVLVSSASHFNRLMSGTKILVTDCTSNSLATAMIDQERGIGDHNRLIICCCQFMPIGVDHAKQSLRYMNSCPPSCPVRKRSPSPRSIRSGKRKLRNRIKSHREFRASLSSQIALLTCCWLPTFIIFKDQQVVSTVQGADPRKLSDLVKKIAAEADSEGSGGFGEASDSDTGWLGTELPKGYENVTDQVDVRGLDLLNADSNLGSARTLFDTSKPSKLPGSKGKETAPSGEETKDWAESDTDEQLMLFIPFQSTLKVHSLHITSLPPEGSNAEADEVTMRPKTIQFYSNRAHVLGFEEADDIEATQAVTLQPRDWDATTGTARIDLRYVKFQNVSSLVLFIVDGDGGGERVRIDRLRIVGEKGSKRELGKLEKIGDETGE
ncbi:MAG: hypothetical protein Q9169_002937 [Polycauliona sp. 2 TL-2023]